MKEPIKPKAKRQLLATIEKLKKQRKIACEYGDVATQQELNYKIFEISRKLNLDYYSIA